MQDFCLRGVSADGSVKLWLAQTTNLCEEGRKRHDAWSLPAAALGRLLTAGVFFGQNLKGNDSVTVRVDGDGPLGALAVVSDRRGEIRGYVENPHVDIARHENGKLNVGAGVGQGYLTVIKDMGFGDPYAGTVELVTGEIGDDIAQYFLESEQTPAAVGLGVLIGSEGTVAAAGGFMLQVMPNADDFTIKQLEFNLANLVPVSQMVADGFTLEEMAADIMLGVEWSELERVPLEYKCTCTKERLSSALVSIGHKEMEALIAEQGEAELVCRFCGQKHNFAKSELEEILAEINRIRFERMRDTLANQVDIEEVAAAQREAMKAKVEAQRAEQEEADYEVCKCENK